LVDLFTQQACHGLVNLKKITVLRWSPETLGNASFPFLEQPTFPGIGNTIA
jgi:hypothetical protein